MPLLRVRRTFVIVLASATLTISCSDTSTGPGTDRVAPEPESLGPVLVHTDLDLDDAMAIMFLIRKGVDVRAIAVAGDGVAEPLDGVPNAQSVIALAGSPDIPVSYGANEALLPAGTFPEAWRELASNLGGADLPRSSGPPSSVSSAQLIVDTVRASPDKLVIIGLAPATDIALALRSDPSLASNIEHMYFTQGDFVNSSATSAKDAEPPIAWNTRIDALATAIVVESGIHVTFVSSNAQHSDPISPELTNRLASAGTTYATFVAQEADGLLSEPNRVFFWDPTTAAVAVDPSICTELTRMHLRIELSPGPDFARTVEDAAWNEIGVCLEADRARFDELMLETLSQP